MFSLLFVCLFVSNFAQNVQRDLHEVFREGWQWPMNKRLNCGGNRFTDPEPDTDPYCDSGKTCLGGGMHFPIASSLFISPKGSHKHEM